MSPHLYGKCLKPSMTSLYKYTVSWSQIFSTVCICQRVLRKSVECLLRLLLVCPVLSCEAERSSSGLRRMKSWLRNNMSQSRLNAVAVSHMHQAMLYGISGIATEFASRSQTRRALLMFGRGHWWITSSLHGSVASIDLETIVDL